MATRGVWFSGIGAVAALAVAAAAQGGVGICQVFTNQADFEQFNDADGKFLKGLEDFEPPVSNVPPGGLAGPLLDPLLGGVPNVDATGLGFPNGLVNLNLLIQSNNLGPGAPFPSPGFGLVALGPDFISPGIPNSVKVGPQQFADGLDLIFDPAENHTGIGFDVIDPIGAPLGGTIIITVFNKQEVPIGQFNWPADNFKVFFGVWCPETIGRINIYAEYIDPVGLPTPGGELVDNIQMWEEPVQVPVCPWDCQEVPPPDKNVGVDDFLAVLAQWGMVGTSCDFGLGPAGVGVDEFLKVLANWGPCPTPPNDECIGATGITRLAEDEVITIHFDMYGATASPEPYKCVAAQPTHKDTWYCLTSNVAVDKLVSVLSTVPLLIEVNDGCSCPPGPLVACGFGAAGTPPFLMVPGQQVLIRLVNDQDLPNDLLKGDLLIMNEPIPAPDGACCDPTDGSCSVVTEVDCNTLAGTYAGDGTDCFDSDLDRIPDAFELADCISGDPCYSGSDPFDPDTDGDGIEDGDEFYGTLGGLDLPGMGADPCRKDIFVETDWCRTNAQAVNRNKLHANQMSRVVTAFANSTVNNPDGSTGITLHVDTGQAPYNNGNEIIDTNDTVDTNSGSLNGGEYYTFKGANFAANRNGYFHYCLMHDKYSIGGTYQNSSGLAELPGDDLIVSMGQWTTGDDNFIGNTLMHELGHNLDLRHGGFENRNFKPNYNSIMNYWYQFCGADNDDDAIPDDETDYSRGVNIDLNEDILDENEGVTGIGPGIDWNTDGDAIDVPVDRNINCRLTNTFANSVCNNHVMQDSPCGTTGQCYDSTCDNLEDYNDWANVDLTNLNDADFAGVEIISCNVDGPALIVPARPPAENRLRR